MAPSYCNYVLGAAELSNFSVLTVDHLLKMLCVQFLNMVSFTLYCRICFKDCALFLVFCIFMIYTTVDVFLLDLVFYQTLSLWISVFHYFCKILGEFIFIYCLYPFVYHLC